MIGEWQLLSFIRCFEMALWLSKRLYGIEPEIEKASKKRNGKGQKYSKPIRCPCLNDNNN